VRVLREVYDFITGGSIAAPVGLACAIAVAVLVPAWRMPGFLGLVVVAFIASVFERPT
jgi:hypothetical protein